MQSDDALPSRLIWLPTAVLMLALATALVALPPFRFGYWERAEPMVAWFHLCGGAGAFALLISAWARPRAILPCLTHPYVIAPLALALWSAGTAPFVALPWLSLMGVPQSGLGGLWFLDIALLVACALAVRDSPAAWKALCWTAALVTLAVAGLKFADQFRHGYGNTLLIYVDAYYGWIGVAVPVLVRPWQWERKAWPLTAAILVAALFSVTTSHSLTAWAALGGGVILVLSARFVPFVADLTNSRRAMTLLVAAAALLPPVILRGLDGFVSSASLRDRIHLQDMVAAAMTQSPAWGIGHGWGRVQDAFHAHLNVTGETLWQPTWVFLTSDYFTSHNWLLDAVHAVGLPGAVLQLLGFLVLPLYASPQARATATALAVAYAVIGGVWFQLSFSLPFFVLGMAAVAQVPSRTFALPQGVIRVSESRQTFPKPKPASGPALMRRKPRPEAARRLRAGFRILSGNHITRLTLAAFAALLIGTAGVLADFGLVLKTARREATSGASSPHPWPVDPRGSDLATAEAIRDAFQAFAEGVKPWAGREPSARNMVATLSARIPETDTAQMVMIGLGVLSYVHFSRELAWLEPELPGSRDLWRPWLDRLLLLAPGRSDLAIPYLTSRATAGDLPEVTRIAGSILRRTPNDPVGLYFQGLVQVLAPESSSKQKGIASFKAAAAAGIERFMPLDPVVRQLVTSP